MLRLTQESLLLFQSHNCYLLYFVKAGIVMLIKEFNKYNLWEDLPETVLKLPHFYIGKNSFTFCQSTLKSYFKHFFFLALEMDFQLFGLYVNNLLLNIMCNLTIYI